MADEEDVVLASASAVIGIKKTSTMATVWDVQ